MPTIPLTLDALAGLALGLVFTFVCLRDLSRAVQWYVALGWVWFFQVAKFSGMALTTGLMQAGLLATIMITVWALRRPPGRLPVVVPTRFNAPLVWLIPLSFVSLVTGYLGLDPAVDASHVNVSVSVGQIMLFVWPIGVYFVVANTIRTTESIRKVVRLVVLLALPAVALPFMPLRIIQYADWSIYFALAASPFCFAASLNPSPLAKRVGAIVLALVPVVFGIQTGKALWYVAPLVAFCVIAALRTKRLLLVFLPLAIGVYLVVYIPLTGSWVPTPLRQQIVREEAQQSLGGRAGRDALAVDAIRIWARHPMLGVGPGNVYPYMDRYSVVGTAHDQYLNILVELGIVGLGCYLVFLGSALKTGLGLLRSVTNPFHETVVLGWIGLFAGVVVVGGLLGDFTLHSIRNDGLSVFSRYYHQWVILGLVVAIKRIESQ